MVQARLASGNCTATSTRSNPASAMSASAALVTSEATRALTTALPRSIEIAARLRRQIAEAPRVTRGIPDAEISQTS